MKLTQTAQRTLIALFFTLVAIACGLAWRAPALGLFREDALYLVTAKAIAAGQGLHESPSPPLFPLLLALFTLVSSHAQWLKLLPLACNAAWLFVSYKLLRKMGAEHWLALLLAGLTAAAPQVVFTATSLLPAPLFGLLLSAALLALLHDRMLLAGTLAGLATLTCTAGVALIAACALTLIVRGRFRRAVAFTAPALFLAAPWFAWTLVHANQDPADYIPGHLAANEKFAVFGSNLLSLFAGPLEILSGIGDPYAALVTLILLAICLWKRRQMVPDTFLLLYCGMILLQLRPPAPLLAPVLPLILWLFFRVFRNFRLREALAATVLILAIVPVAATLMRLPATLRTGQFPLSDQPPNQWQEMNKLFTFIRLNTPPDAILAANNDPLFYLNTGRKTVRGFVPDAYRTFYQSGGQTVNARQLSFGLRAAGVSYVALTPDRDLAESAAFHKSVEALERAGILEPVAIPGLAPEYRLLQTP